MLLFVATCFLGPFPVQAFRLLRLASRIAPASSVFRRHGGPAHRGSGGGGCVLGGLGALVGGVSGYPHVHLALDLPPVHAFRGLGGVASRASRAAPGALRAGPALAARGVWSLRRRRGLREPGLPGGHADARGAALAVQAVR